MEKSLFITEKPSVAMDYIKLLKINGKKRDGYIESDKAIFTWCVGHMVTMSYPEAYDIELKRWSLKTLPFIPKTFKYEVIPGVKSQFEKVKPLLNREDIKTIYVCTDSGREGEYIYRLVDEMVGVKGKDKKRVWLDSLTEDEVKRGIREAKDLSFYDSLSDAAYLRAKEDYLLGINFSRLLTLVYGESLKRFTKEDSSVIAVGRVMSCVLSMVVERERDFRNFIKTPFYKINASFNVDENSDYKGDFKADEVSKYFESVVLYNDGGFKTKEDAEKLIEELKKVEENDIFVDKIIKSKENKNPPLLFNLAEIQNECAKRFKINPDETLNVIQNLYEKKLVTYPRTDARVISTAVAKEINKNLVKINKFSLPEIKNITKKILENKWYAGLEKTKYVDDKKITDHYAIIPTGEGFETYNSLNKLNKDIYEVILRRFLAIFYPRAEFSKMTIITKIGKEHFYTMDKVCKNKGFLEVLSKDEKQENNSKEFLKNLKKNQRVKLLDLELKEGETSPPKRYNSGSIILAMENAGKLIEEDELREQIKGQGIGTSATRAEILKKLDKIKYIKINNKNQIITSTQKGEFVYEVIKDSVPTLLNPVLTASWEKGLTLVAEKKLTKEEFMDKLKEYINKNFSNALRHNGVFDINKIYKTILNKDNEILDEEEKVLGVCPICKKGVVVKNKKGYGCSNWESGCKFFVGEICGVIIEKQEIKNLMKYGKTHIISGFKSKKGNEFSTRLIIKNKKIEFDFK
ncbi:MAG: DNA topoisomerase [Clostridiaceae bacterium]